MDLDSLSLDTDVVRHRREARSRSRSLSADEDGDDGHEISLEMMELDGSGMLDGDAEQKQRILGGSPARGGRGADRDEPPPRKWSDEEVVPWDGPCRTLGIGPVLLQSRLNWLLLACPLALISDVALSEGFTFTFSLLGLVPLAASMGFLTEQVAMRTNQTLGGLINASLGNATELIISLFALKHNMLRIIQVSLLGSILSNMLLVLGSAFLLGGFRYRVQKFNKDHSIISSGLLMLAVMGILFPAVLLSTDVAAEGAELKLSRFSAIFLLIVYVAFLYFQLKTHHDLFESEEDEDDEPLLTLREAIAWLVVVTILVAVFSEFLVRTIEGTSKSWGTPQIFIGVILIPIVGNAAEHASAITAAYRNKMDLCIGVAIGSSTQIALFGVPFMVIIAWMLGKPLSMYFRVFETATVFASVIIVSFLSSDGQSNWMHGLMLVVAYTLISASFFFHLDDA